MADDELARLERKLAARRGSPGSEENVRDLEARIARLKEAKA